MNDEVLYHEILNDYRSSISLIPFISIKEDSTIIETLHRTKSGVKRIDLTFDLVIHNSIYRIYGEVKRHVIPRVVESHIVQLHSTYAKLNSNATFLLLADHINESAKTILRKRNINYYDRSGDFYFSEGSSYIFISTPLNNSKKVRKLTDGLSKRQVEVIEFFIQNPKSVSESMRALSTLIAASRGTIHSTIKYLENNNHVQTLNGSRTIIDMKSLIQLYIDCCSDLNRSQLVLDKLSHNTPE